MRERIRGQLNTLLERLRRYQLDPETIASLIEIGEDDLTIQFGRAPGTIDVQRGDRPVGSIRASLEALPIRDRAVDRAFLMKVLGRVGNREVVLRETWRALEPGGRLVVAEARPDPDALPRAILLELARRERFEYDRGVERRLAYAEAFEKPRVTDLA